MAHLGILLGSGRHAWMLLGLRGEYIQDIRVCLERHHKQPCEPADQRDLTNKQYPNVKTPTNNKQACFHDVSLFSEMCQHRSNALIQKKQY